MQSLYDSRPDPRSSGSCLKSILTLTVVLAVLTTGCVSKVKSNDKPTTSTNGRNYSQYVGEVNGIATLNGSVAEKNDKLVEDTNIVAAQGVDSWIELT
ncbi:MAG: ABC-type Fe3+-hydroxamate transport system substrate-binding protein [Arenicella sp.]|jgi:ABC-type Fe3+-hydroxamate transport system substrate-binding protein